MSKIISLKEDKEPKRIIVYVGGEKAHHAYFFENGHGIDCFHRLNIPAKALKILYRIAKTQDKSRVAGPDSMNEIFDKIDKLWAEYHGMIHDPYELDIERADDFKNIAFRLYDYDYEYELMHHREGWSVACRISFYKDLKEPYVEMDEPYSFLEEHEQQNAQMEKEHEYFKEMINGSESDEMVTCLAKTFWDDYLERKRDMHSKDALRSEIIDSIISSIYFIVDGKRYRSFFNTTKSSLSRSANAICSEHEDLGKLLDYLKDDNNLIKKWYSGEKVCNDYALTDLPGIGDVTSCKIVRAMRVKYLGQSY